MKATSNTDDQNDDEDIVTLVTNTTVDNHSNPDNEQYDDRVVEKLKITLPSSSPIWSSCCSSSSESSSSSRVNKIRKRFCVTCNQRFRKTSELHKHLLTHVTQPSVQLERLSESNKYYQDFLKRQAADGGGGSDDTSSGFKIKLKVLSGAQNFEVIPNALDEANRGKGIRILTAKEIKLSPTRSPSTANASPLDAMVALSEMTFSDNSNSNANYMTEQDKVHFECPTLDGLDQFNEEVNKEAAAQLLKQLLETPQMPQENEWTPTNEYISIDRLAHMCPVCHSNFPDAVMLYEHKRITGHDFQNLFQNQQPMPNNGVQRPFLRPRPQTQLAAYGQPQLHQMNQNQYPHHQQSQQQQQQQQGTLMQQQDHAIRYGVRYPMRPQMPQRRTPPPLYRPNGQTLPQNQHQPLNMAPFMSMSPDMYNPMPGVNGMNSNTIMNSNAQPFAPNPRISPLQRSSPQQRVSPLQRVSPHVPQQQITAHPQQQQFNSPGMMRPPMNMNMMRQMRPGQPVNPQMAARQPLYTMKRASNGMMVRTQITPQPAMASLTPQFRPNRVMGPPAKKIKVEDGDDCEVISMQPRSDGLPVIHSVQGGANTAESNANTNATSSNNAVPKPSEPYQLSEITVSVKGKDQPNKNPKEVANILAHRGITVTSSKPADQREKSPVENGSTPTTNVTTEEAVQKIQLNSSVSIIQKKKPPTIDLSNDDDVVPVPTVQKAMPCPIKDCTEVFANQENLNRHMQRGHRTPQLRINRCRLCPAKFSSPEGLIMHQKKVHRVFKTTPSELGLPVVDLRNEQTRSKLSQLGIYNYIPLSHLNRSVDGVFGLPIVSVQGAANSAVCNLAALGADNLLSIGPVKAIPKNPTVNNKPTES